MDNHREEVEILKKLNLVRMKEISLDREAGKADPEVCEEKSIK